MEQTKQVSVLNFQEISTMGKVFAESGMFSDAKAAAQAIVKIQAGQEIGIPPFAAMSGIHIIQGKPAIGAGLMASCVKGSGKYDYEVKEMDEKICTIEFKTKAGKLLGTSTFTIEDARKAQTKNLDKFPKNMLFARAMSNGVKWFTPDVFSGPVYTPEELGGENKTEDIPHEEVKEVLPTIPPAPKTKSALSKDALSAAIKRLENGEDISGKLAESFTINPAQQKLIDAAKLKGEQLLSAIKGLYLAETETDIDTLISQLDVTIIENAAFVDAKGKRIEVIMASQA
jgi:hypothetical protein